MIRWKYLFKEATNVGYMVKYMFREDLKLAKAKFTEAVGNADNFRKMENAKEVRIRRYNGVVVALLPLFAAMIALFLLSPRAGAVHDD
jgi:hypothetical protein